MREEKSVSSRSLLKRCAIFLRAEFCEDLHNRLFAAHSILEAWLRTCRRSPICTRLALMCSPTRDPPRAAIERRYFLLLLLLLSWFLFDRFFNFQGFNESDSETSSGLFTIREEETREAVTLVFRLASSILILPFAVRSAAATCPWRTESANSSSAARLSSAKEPTPDRYTASNRTLGGKSRCTTLCSAALREADHVPASGHVHQIGRLRSQGRALALNPEISVLI